MSGETGTPAINLTEVDCQASTALVGKSLNAKIEGPTDAEEVTTDYSELRRVYDDTYRELKAANRDIRDQSIQIRDLKRQNTQLHERNSQQREQNEQLKEAHRARGEKLSKSEKTRFIEHFEMLEDHIAHLQHERQKRESHMQSLTTQTREANEVKTSLEAANRRLQRQVNDLSNNLTECKDDLLRLQPTSQVSDNEISEQYANLDQQIAGWVDDKTDDTQLLEDQIEKIRSVDDLPNFFQNYMSSDYLKLAKKFPESQPLLIRYLIHRCLGTFILSNEIYLFGLDARNIALLQGMEEGMKLLEPHRGKSPFSKNGKGDLTTDRCCDIEAMEVRNPTRSSQDGELRRRATPTSRAGFSNIA